MKYVCPLHYLCAKTGYMQQVLEFYFNGAFCRLNAFHILWLLRFGLLKVKNTDGSTDSTCFIWVWVKHHTTPWKNCLIWLYTLSFAWSSFHLHILLTCYVAVHYVWIQLCRELITCFDVYVDVCRVAFFLVHLASFRLSFFFVCLCRPTLFSFQFHVIAIVTLACTLLGHHWSMLTGRYNLIGSLRDKRKCVMSWGTFTPLIHRHSNLNFFVVRAVWL